jgi:Berberine and berberine like
VPADATAFPHREELFLLEHSVVVPADFEGAATEAARAWLSDSWELVHSSGSGGVYANFPDTDLPDEHRAYWGGNLERVLRVKEKYDPEGVIGWDRFVASGDLPAETGAAGLEPRPSRHAPSRLGQSVSLRTITPWHTGLLRWRRSDTFRSSCQSPGVRASCHWPSKDSCPSVAEKRWANVGSSRQMRSTPSSSETPYVPRTPRESKYSMTSPSPASGAR